MKFFFRLLIVFSAILLFFSACQKEFTIEEDLDPPVDPPVVLDSTFLDMIVELDSIGPTEFDTAYITRYQYDAAKRVIAVRQFWDDGGGIAVMDEYLYSYNGTDTLPATCINHSYDYGGGQYNKDTTVTHFFYSNGRLIKDSAIDYSTILSNGSVVSLPTDTTVVTYSYSPSRITSVSLNREGNRLIPSVPGETEQRDTAVLDSRGNVIASKEYFLFGTTWQQSFSSTFTYDDKPSPFSRLSNFRTLFPIAPPESMYFEMQTPNNRTSYRYDYGSGNTQERDYAGFVYRPDGLPISVLSSEPGTVADLKIKFFYKSL